MPAMNRLGHAVIRCAAFLLLFSPAAYLFVPVPPVSADSDPPTTAPASAPATNLDFVRSALRLSPRDALLLSAQRDGIDPAEQNGFYRLMRIVSDLPPLTAEEQRQLDSPAWANLVRRPKQYRLEPIRLTVRIYVVRRLTTGRGLHSNPYWPDGKPVYELHAVVDTAPEEPLLLYAPRPPEDLGPPAETLPDGRVRYSSAPPYQIAAVYLQSYAEVSVQSAQAGKREKRDYPVLLVWQIEPVRNRLGVWSGLTGQTFWSGGILIALPAAAAGYFLLRQRMRRPAAPADRMFRHYRPLREETREGEKKEEPVDPDLAEAVERYRRQQSSAPSTAQEHP